MLHPPTSENKTKNQANNSYSPPVAEQEHRLYPPSRGQSALSSWGRELSNHRQENLQKTYGNQAVLRMNGGVLQRKCACGTGNCAECQSKREGTLQTKLRISEPGDKYEQEADRIADQVMRMPEPLVQQQVKSEEENSFIQKKPHLTVGERKDYPVRNKFIAGQITPLGQQQIDMKEDGSETIQTKNKTSPNIVAPIQILEKGGQPLPKPTRNFFESRFGYDFENVRLHTDADAARSAANLYAKAYTVGNNIVFGSGNYKPETVEGQHLLAHELTHVIQQNRATDQTTVQRLTAPNCDTASVLPFSDSCTSYNNTCYSRSFTASGGTLVEVNVTVDYHDPDQCSFPEGQEDFRVRLKQCGWFNSEVKNFETQNIGKKLSGKATLPGSGFIQGNNNYYLEVFSRSNCQLESTMSVT